MLCGMYAVRAFPPAQSIASAMQWLLWRACQQEDGAVVEVSTLKDVCYAGMGQGSTLRTAALLICIAPGCTHGDCVTAQHGSTCLVIMQGLGTWYRRGVCAPSHRVALGLEDTAGVAHCAMQLQALHVRRCWC